MKKINVLIEEQNKEIRALKLTFSDFNIKHAEIKVVAPAMDTLPLTKIVTDGINSIQKNSYCATKGRTP